MITFSVGDRASAGLIGEDHTAVALSDLVPGAPPDMIEVIRRWDEVAPRLLDPDLRAVAGISLDRVRLLAPIPRPARNVFCVGWNYAEHFAEGRGARSAATPQTIPDHPAFFSKNPSTVVGPDADVRHPAPHSTELDWEVELAVVIGRGGRDIPERSALEHVFGYTVANDVSVRDVQRRHGGQWFKGKNFDTHCPLGPWIVTADEIPDPQVLAISSRVNGETKQSSNTRHMVFSVARIVAELSAGMALEPGDVILTGTPSGVGFARTPPEFLSAGDVMEMEIEGIGALRNRVVAA